MVRRIPLIACLSGVILSVAAASAAGQNRAQGPWWAQGSDRVARAAARHPVALCDHPL